MNEHRILPTAALTGVEEILQPALSETMGLTTCAREILTDFKVARPLMIEQSTPVAIAKELMTRAHVRLRLVIDREERFKGIITLADLVSVKVMRAQGRTGLGVNELSVADVMTHRKDLHGIDIRQFSHATIGDILVTMKTFGDQHVLVLDSEKSCICGLVSSSDIARALHETVYIPERATSFSDIYQAVRG